MGKINLAVDQDKKNFKNVVADAKTRLADIRDNASGYSNSQALGALSDLAKYMNLIIKYLEKRI